MEKKGTWVTLSLGVMKEVEELRTGQLGLRVRALEQISSPGRQNRPECFSPAPLNYVCVFVHMCVCRFVCEEENVCVSVHMCAFTCMCLGRGTHGPESESLQWCRRSVGSPQ